MMKPKCITAVLCTVLLLSGCSAQKAAPAVNEQTPVPTAVLEEAAGKAIWDAFSKNWGDTPQIGGTVPSEPDLYPLYLEGMRHSSANVRWYCASIVMEYANHEKKKEIIEALDPLLKDPDETVRRAAAFSTKVLGFSFSGPEFVKSPTCNDVVFFNWQESRYNDGKLWYYSAKDNEVWMVKRLDGSLGSMHWSPDGRKISVSYGGRTWINTVILDIDTFEAQETNLITYIYDKKTQLGYKLGSSQRADPCVGFVEWSPDSSRVLLSYSINDDDMSPVLGLALMNIQNGKIEKIIPSGTTEKPKDFKW